MAIPEPRSAAVAGANASLSIPRVWPAVVLVAAYWIARFVTGSVLDLSIYAGFLSLVAASVLLILLFFGWWLIFSRIKFTERLLAVLLVVVAGFITQRVSDKSVGLFSVVIFGMPLVISVWTLWLWLARRRPIAIQRAGLVAVLCLVLGPFNLMRVDGVDGSQRSAIHWRWSARPEELFLAERGKLPAGAQPQPPEQSAERSPLKLGPGDWPGFRGPQRDGTLHGVKFATNWDTASPKEVWRKRVGPGWSSFAVIGNRLFTQEQRGDVEAVVCLDADSGGELWSHENKARFWEMVAGAGPRATPTFDDGRIYALGATGMLDCLDAATGKPLWSRNIVEDSGAALPMWGFSSSPLVIDGVVIVYAGGPDPKGLLAYHDRSGEPAWTAATGPISYSSPQLITFGGESEVLLLSDRGVIAVRPKTGAIAWEYPAPAPNIWRAVQPRSLGTSQVLIGSEDLGLVLLDLARQGENSTATQHWTSRSMRPAYNDFVLQDGFLYGFDGGVFCCSDAATGKRRWKAGRYGHGQVLLIADEQLLLVLSESGEVVLLRATPEKHQEIARLQAIHGKTWNHPVIAHGRLYVRNDEEMACYQLLAEELPAEKRAALPAAIAR